MVFFRQVYQAIADAPWDKVFPPLFVGMCFYVWHAQIGDATKQIASVQVNLARIDVQQHEFARRSELSDGLTKLKTEQFQYTLNDARHEDQIQLLKQQLTARESELHQIKRTLDDALLKLQSFEGRLENLYNCLPTKFKHCRQHLRGIGNND